MSLENFKSKSRQLSRYETTRINHMKIIAVIYIRGLYLQILPLPICYFYNPQNFTQLKNIT